MLIYSSEFWSGKERAESDKEPAVELQTKKSIGVINVRITSKGSQQGCLRYRSYLSSLRQENAWENGLLRNSI